MNAPFTASPADTNGPQADQHAASKPKEGPTGEAHRHKVPGTFGELLQGCPEPYRDTLSGTLTDPREKAEYQAEILVQAMELVPLLAHEWTLLRDIGDLTVELSRYRHIQAQFLDEGRREVLTDLLVKDGWDLGQAAATANADVAGEPRIRQQVDKVLAGIHLNRQVIDARAYERRPPDAINRLVADVSKRRARIVRDLQSGTGEPRSRRSQG